MSLHIRSDIRLNPIKMPLRDLTRFIYCIVRHIDVQYNIITPDKIDEK